MATNFTINGVSYPFPQTGDQNWGDNVTNWAAAVSSGLLQKAGGAFTLTAEVDFGTTYGLKSAYFKSRATNPAAAGQVRLGTAEVIAWRNNANGADLPLTTDASDNLLFNGHIITGSAGVVPVASGGTGLTSYTTGDMLYASGATTLAKVGIGAVTTILGSTGTAPQWGQLVNAQVSASAAIAYSKLALTGSILNADLAGSIAYSKLVLTGAILNADLAGSIAYSKLATLNTGQILVGNAGVPTATTLGGDATIGATGTLTIGAKAVQASKLDSGVASSGNVATADGSGGVSYAAPAAAPNQSYEITNLGIACSVGASALTISLKQKDGSTDPSTGAAAVKIGFRDSTSATGDFVQRSVTGSLSTVISSGSTAGFTSGVTEYLYVYAIDNAGTVEIGWMGGGAILDEGTVQSSTAEGGAGAADNRYTFYSTTARTSKAIRLIARLKFALTTAGTWDAVPTEIYLYQGRFARQRSSVQVSTGNGHGSTNTKIRRFTTTLLNIGTAITYADSSTNGGSFTINEEGIYSIHYSDAQSGGGCNIGISLNSAQLTTTVTSITDSTLLAFGAGSGAGDTPCISVTIRLKPGDVIRAHDEGSTMVTTTYQTRFFITKIEE